MNYGYIRVSTDKQTVENQRFEINRFCERENIVIDHWIEETISGSKEPEQRKLGPALSKLRKDDILICTEISRLGRSLLMIMGILNQCLKREIQIWTIKDNYRLGTDISSKVLAFAFGLSAEIERNLISQRTKEALARKRAEGVILGRPKGRKSTRVKLTGRDDDIRRLLARGLSKTRIARRLKVHRITLAKFIRAEQLEPGLLPQVDKAQ
jgi:DNA invertase Pin-like site-specific DNA recombinase